MADNFAESMLRRLWRIAYFPIKQAYDLAQSHRERRHWHAYYAIPAFIGFAVTYGIVQVIDRLYPTFHFSAQGYHIHHYTYGIIILLTFGYIGIWAQSLRVRFWCALAYGVGAAFIIDEAFIWFTLTPVPHYQDYDLAFFAGAILLGLALTPLFSSGRTRNHLPQ